MESQKSIVVFTNTLLSGGAEKQALLLAGTLNKTHKVLLVVYYGEKVEDKFRQIIEKEKINTIYLFGGHNKKLVSFYKLLRQNKVYIIFSYLLTTNLIGAVVGKLAGVKFPVGGIRNAKLDANKLQAQRFINNHLSAYTIYNNHAGLEELRQKGFDAKNALVIPNGFQINTSVIRRTEKEPVQIITVGRFVAQKGYFEGLKLMKALKDEGVKFKYIIIGFGELESEIRAQATALQLNDVVEILINPPNINEYYLKSDIYLCTSFFEGVSNTIMEALSFSLPVVATNVGDNNQLVQHGQNGYIIPDFDPQSYMEPLKSLIASPELRNNMGEKSFEVLKENYSMEAFTSKYQDFINRCESELNNA